VGGAGQEGIPGRGKYDVTAEGGIPGQGGMTQRGGGGITTLFI